MLLKIEEIIPKYQRALKGEIDAIKDDLKDKGAMYPSKVIEGYLMEENGNGYLYRFKVERLRKEITPDTRAFYRKEDENLKGYIVSSDADENLVFVQIETYIGKKVNEGILEFDLTYLLNELKTKLGNILTDSNTENEKFCSQIAKYLFESRWSIGKEKLNKNYNLNISQKSAVEKAIGSNICILWGPPGTGKTRTLSALTNELINFHTNNKIIITTHTNIALDSIMNKIVAVANQQGETYNILRYGRATQELDPKVPTLDTVVEKYLKEDYPNLFDRVNRFCTKILTKEPSLLLVGLRKAIRIAKDKQSKAEVKLGKYLKEKLLREKEKLTIKAIKEADVLGSTLSKFYCDDRLYKFYDIAIVDEVSIAYPAQLLFIASRLKKKIVLAGDFKQLPPIVLSEDNRVKKYLERNIYEVLQLDEEYIDHDVRPVLDTQYRMHPDICAIVNQLFYAGRVRTTKDILKRVESEIINRPQEKKCNYHPLILLDTSNCDSCYCNKVGESRNNNFHSKIVLDLISQLKEEKSVGVITPYRGQMKLIKDKFYRLEYSMTNITVSTVHSFQGQEKDIIIFDLVDAPEIRPYFLDGNRNRHLTNLINVAISRAKERLILIIHKIWFDRFQKEKIISMLVNRVTKLGKVISIDEDFNNLDLFDYNKNTPPSIRLMTVDEIKKNITPKESYIWWNDVSLPVLDIHGDKVKVSKSIKKGIQESQKEILFPIYEIEAIRNGKEFIRTIRRGETNE